MTLLYITWKYIYNETMENDTYLNKFLILSILIDIAISYAFIRVSQAYYQDYKSRQARYNSFLALNGIHPKLYKRSLFKDLLAKTGNKISEHVSIPDKLQRIPAQLKGIYTPITDNLILVRESFEELEGFYYIKYLKVYLSGIYMAIVAMLTLVFIILEIC